jgi:hypothetical protein
LAVRRPGAWPPLPAAAALPSCARMRPRPAGRGLAAPAPAALEAAAPGQAYALARAQAPLPPPSSSPSPSGLLVTRFVPFAAPTRLWSSLAQLEARARFNTLRLALGRSRIDGTGLFAGEAVAMDDVLAEYTGDLIGEAVCEARERYYEARGVADYMFRLGPDEIVDATVSGCRARYINHCCDPNCFAVITLPEQAHAAQHAAPAAASPGARAARRGAGAGAGDPAQAEAAAQAEVAALPEAAAPPESAAAAAAAAEYGLAPPGLPKPRAARSGRRVFIYALRRIERGEELTYDYSFSADEKLVPCRCGAAACRGSLNVV